MESDWLIRRMPRWEKAHARFWAGARVAIGIWLLVLTAILYGYRRAGWWTPLLVLAAAAHFYVARRLLRLADERKAPPAAA